LGPIIEDVCKHGEILASEKNIQIRVDIKESMLINGDGNKLRQMIWNLIYNAIKYTQPGGEIEISLEENQEFANITVQDDGIGIPEEDLPLIFNRFYRVDKARSRKEGGSGLGLSICMYIVKLHKGELKVESEFGKGSKFMVSLPKIGDPKLQTA
jgi:signal transduction histidine kinase